MRTEEQLAAAGDAVLWITFAQLDHARITVDDHRATVNTGGNRLDTPDGTGGKVGEHARPVERATIGQAQRKAAVGDEAIGFAAAGAELTRGGVEDVVHGAIELAGACEACGKGGVGDGEVGVIQEAPREVGTAGARKLGRGDADVLIEQATQMAGGHAEARGEGVLGLAFEGTSEDELHGAANELGPVPAHGLALAVGTAAEASAEAGGRGDAVATDVPRVGRGDTVGTAVDPRSDDRRVPVGEDAHTRSTPFGTNRRDIFGQVRNVSQSLS